MPEKFKKSTLREAARVLREDHKGYPKNIILSLLLGSAANEISELEEGLRRVEWSGFNTALGVRCCPLCRAAHNTRHDATCTFRRFEE